MPGKVAACQGLPRLTKGIQTCAARHQNGLVRPASIEHTLEPVSPALHLVEFIKYEHRRRGRPRLSQHHPTIGQNIPVKDLGPWALKGELMRKGGLASLTRTGQKHHLGGEVALQVRRNGTGDGGGFLTFFHDLLF